MTIKLILLQPYVKLKAYFKEWHKFYINQGKQFSPVLFNLYLDDNSRTLESQSV